MRCLTGAFQRNLRPFNWPEASEERLCERGEGRMSLVAMMACIGVRG
ncbi:hypothetical protein SS05631_b61410 (plasmid) [Sinorhizobium sp. CCBAU 05631]|nr:hypothetical protein SS05631_b61410 [Sinorhizobium sp. CCBAU 05631]